ncbi:MAG: hydrogenase expression/formation protein HypE [Proteobacteria bacterium]|nr:hydrogenase expression/formation protein HypE [Pseudomonadota bacterium]
MNSKSVTMNFGSGGREMHQFINAYIVEKLKNGILEKLDDAAILENFPNKKLAMTTDNYVVSPIFFEGGDIGKLCICGTVNDLATSGAKPYAISLAFILEEDVPLDVIKRIMDSIVETAKEADVKIVTGDTKVVEKGKGDLIYINTCGIGFIDDGANLSSHNAKPGDSVIITGPIGNHEVAMMKAREMINFDVNVKSDVAPLNKKIETLLTKTKNIHTIKDPTRGGLASALNEICEHSKCGIRLIEKDIPVDREVRAVCDLIGFDPLYLANEGKFIIICPKDDENSVLTIFGPSAKVIGEIIKDDKHLLTLLTKSGGIRKMGMLETIQLPRIC